MMLSITEAIIYLSAQRGCSQSDWYRSYHTFNFGAYKNEHRKPFGALQAFNDETLKAGSTRKWTVEKDTTVLIIPVVGGLDYRSGGMGGSLEAGQALLFFVPHDETFEITNPFESELVNFLQIRFPGNSDVTAQQFELELNRKNALIPLQKEGMKPSPVPAYIGTFDGRKEGMYALNDPSKGVFAFVIEGVFEVENRLLHPRDGLALRNTKTVEFEALSNDAILLVFEV